MQFSYADNGSRSKAGKLALAAGLQAAVGVLFVHSMNMRHISLSGLQEAGWAPPAHVWTLD